MCPELPLTKVFFLYLPPKYSLPTGESVAKERYEFFIFSSEFRAASRTCSSFS